MWQPVRYFLRAGRSKPPNKSNPGPILLTCCTQGMCQFHHHRQCISWMFDVQTAIESKFWDRTTFRTFHERRTLKIKCMSDTQRLHFNANFEAGRATPHTFCACRMQTSCGKTQILKLAEQLFMLACWLVKTEKIEDANCRTGRCHNDCST